MTESNLLLLLELLGGLHDDTNSRKVADATLVVKRACQARLSRLRRQPRIPSMPLYLDPLQIDFVTDQTPTAVDNPVGTVENTLDDLPVVLRSGDELVIEHTDGVVNRVTLNGEEVKPDGKAHEEGREGEALLTHDWTDRVPD